MNIFQKTLGIVFPPFKFSVLRREQNKLFIAIISALPDDFSEIKNQTLSERLFGLNDWELFPDYKFVVMAYGGDTFLKYKKRGHNFKITGLRVFSKQNNKFENIEILIENNLVCGLKITNSAYLLNEFDIRQIKADNVAKTDFTFPPTTIDLFYNGLDTEIKQKLNPDDLSEIDFNNRIYYSFYDLEDGNYLAVDKNLKVYSLVHDAKPMAKGMKITFIDILSEIAENKFDKEKHLDERYRKSKYL